MARGIRSRVPVGVRRGDRRETDWFTFMPFGTAQLTAAGGTLYFSLNAAALAQRPFTVIRTQFEWFLRSDTISANESYAAAMGIAVVSSQAVAIGVTAVPTPVTDADSDLFFAYKAAVGHLAFTTGTGYRNVGDLYHIDSKAMRKVETGQDIIVVAELDAAFGQGVFSVIGGRMLIKNH